MSTTVKPGDRVRVTGIQPGDPAPLPVGATGTVTDVNESIMGGPGQIYVDWDRGVNRTLMLLTTDPFEVIT